MSMTSPESGVAAQQHGGLLSRQSEARPEQTPGIHAVIADLHNAVELASKMEDHVRARFTSVVSEEPPAVIASNGDHAIDPRGSSHVHNDIAEATARLRQITNRLNDFAGRSEVG